MLLRDVAWLLMAMAYGGMMIYAVSFHRRIAQLESRLVTTEVAVSAHLKDSEGQRVAIGSALTQLQIAVFGTRPPPQVITKVQPWQRNRDHWFNSRLDALERWRLEHENKDAK